MMPGLDMAKRALAAWLTLLPCATLVSESTPTGAVPAAQNQLHPSFKVDVRLVEVDAVVTDAEGRLVPDLQKGEFQVLENGRPQEASFRRGLAGLRPRDAAFSRSS